jgi:signal transduction histidine kinase
MIAGLLYLLMPMAVWMLLRAQNNWSVTVWCGGSEIFGLSLILLALRDSVPDAVSFTLANFLLYLGALLRVESFRMKLERPLGWATVVFSALLMVSVFELLRRFSPHPKYHFLWSIALLAGLFASLSWSASQIARRDGSRSALWLTFIYVPVIFLLAVRFAMVSMDVAQPGVLHNDLTGYAMIIFGVFSAVVSQIGFLGFHTEAATRNELLAVAAKAKLEESLLLGQQISQLDRVRSVGQLSTSLAHELSQPLTNINLLIQCADSELQALPSDAAQALSEYMKDMARSTQLATDILQRIRRFIQGKPTEKTRVSINAIVTEVADLLRDWMTLERVRPAFHFPQGELWVLGDGVQLSQILMNVYRNAVQATTGHQDRQLLVTVRREGHQVRVQIEDNGPGLSSETMAQIHQPFFSTKPDGLGVGLSISRTIAEQHGGSLQIANGPEGGACVTLTLPFAA